MSFVTALRDYAEQLTTTSLHLSEHQTVIGLLQATIIYIFQTVKYLICYIATFQWFRDVTYLPLIAPQISLSVLKENLYPLDNPTINLFTILQPSVAQNNKWLVGFVNSCFACLPFSCAHLLIARRLIVEGVPAGVASGFGTVVGQCCLLVCILCGLRGFVIPWLSLEPLTYFLGVYLLLSLIYNMIHERTIKVLKWEEKQKLFLLFAFNLALTLCEQTSLFLHLSNLSLGAEPTFLESFAATTPLEGLLAHGSYLLSFFIGSLVFTAFFSWLFLFLKETWLWRSKTLTNSRIIRRLNWIFQVVILAFSFASIPYYGVDYLVLKGAGFLPADKALYATPIYPHTLKKAGSIGHVSAGHSFDTDVAPFDRGWYVKPEHKFPRSYEELNFQGELAWLRRIERLPTFQKRKLSKSWRGWLKTRFHTLHNIPLEKSLREEWMRKKRKVRQARERALDREEKRYVFGDDIDIDGEWKRERTREELPSFHERDEQEKDTVLALRRNLSSGLSSPLYKRGQLTLSLLEKRFKKKFYKNKIYKLLLRFDIDTFLGRQPSSRLISTDQEKDLFEERQMLFRYYNSLREYRKMDDYAGFEALNLGSKSYADRVYNQQFKGTVKVARKLFSVTLDPYRNPFGRRVLKYDQPLPEGGNTPFIHEEIGPLFLEKEKLQLEKQDSQTTRLLNGETTSERKESSLEHSPQSPFLEETNPRPLYVGWDEQVRKMVITNRFLPRTISLYQRQEKQNQTREKTGKAGVEDLLPAKSIPFTAWPLDTKGCSQPKTISKVPYETIIDCENDPVKKPILNKLNDFVRYMEIDYDLRPWTTASWPENLRAYESLKMKESWNLFRPIFPPTRGGFIWPGNQKLEFDIKKLINITRY